MSQCAKTMTDWKLPRCAKGALSRGAYPLDFVCVIWLVMGSHALAGELVGGPRSLSGDGFELTLEAERVSLQSENASLKAVLEGLGQLFDVEVLTDLPTDERISAEFDGLDLQRAVSRLTRNAAYEWETAGGEQRIKRIHVMRSGLEGGLLPPAGRGRMLDADSSAGAEEREAEPEPFRFEFDPSANE